MPELIYQDETGKSYLYDTPEDAAAVAYGQLIGNRDYESAGRLAERMPSVLDEMGAHEEVVARREDRHKTEMDAIQGLCVACDWPIYTRSKHVPTGLDYHRNCYRAQSG